MKEWNGDLHQSELYQLDHWHPPAGVLLFDIETTGFSPRNTMLYLIGFCYFQDNSWHYRMLFNNDGQSEYQMLKAFLQVLQDYSVIIHFNGDGFDLPYLIEKCRQYQTPDLLPEGSGKLTELESIDLYKCIRTYKKGLPLPNLKLTTIEAALHLHRTDSHSGGELIRIYRDFLKEPDAAKEKQLFQHNYEDILAMIPLLQLLHFQGLQEQDWELVRIRPMENQFRLTLHLHHPLPLRYTVSTPYVDFNGYENQAVIQIPIIRGEMKYFLPDWKDYYYLPAEDRVIHKSIAAYVDAAYKEKAKKDNCYLKKEGCFLPYPRELSNSRLRFYRREDKESLVFVELTEIDSDSSTFWLEYLKYAF